MSETEVPAVSVGTLGYRSAETQTCVTAEDVGALTLRLIGAYLCLNAILAASRVMYYTIQSRGWYWSTLGGEVIGLVFFVLVGGAFWKWARPWARKLVPPNPAAPVETRQPLSPASLLSAGLSFLGVFIAVTSAIPGIIATVGRLFLMSQYQSLNETVTSVGPELVRDIVQLVVAIWLYRNSRKLTRGWERRERETDFLVDVESSGIVRPGASQESHS
jgi:hypothetical protein